MLEKFECLSDELFLSKILNKYFYFVIKKIKDIS